MKTSKRAQNRCAAASVAPSGRCLKSELMFSCMLSCLRMRRQRRCEGNKQTADVIQAGGLSHPSPSRWLVTSYCVCLTRLSCYLCFPNVFYHMKDWCDRILQYSTLTIIWKEVSIELCIMNVPRQPGAHVGLWSAAPSWRPGSEVVRSSASSLLGLRRPHHRSIHTWR